jgi:hypothetical protein
MNKSFQSNIKSIKLAIIWLFIIVLFTSIIFLGLDIFNITTFIGFTKNYDWLSFFGGLLGGAVGGIATFLGVYFTLKHQKHSDDENNRLLNIPILEFKISYNKEDFDNSSGQLSGEVITHINILHASYQDKDCLEWYYNFIISNEGMGHAQLKGIDFIINTSDGVFLQKEQIGYSYKLVKKGTSKSFKFMIYAPSKTNNIENQYSIKLMVHYQDLLGNNYIQRIHTGIASSELENKNRINHADLSHYESFQLIGR